MKQLFKTYPFILALCMSMLLLNISAQPSMAMDDAIIAVINDEIVTLKDLKDYIHSVYVSLVADGVDKKRIESIMTDLQKNGLNKIIEDKLILSEANKIGLEIREELVEERVLETRNKYKTEQEFIDALVTNGATITDLKNKIRNQLKIQYVVEALVKSKIYVNPKEVTTYYEGHADQFQKKEQVNVDSIFVPFTANKNEARETAKTVLRRIQEGNAFPSVAKEYSNAPSIGTVERGQLVPHIENVIFNLTTDQISSPLETESGIYIFKLNEKIPPQTAALEDVKDAINNYLFQKKFQENFTTWLNKLKEKAYIEIKE